MGIASTTAQAQCCGSPLERGVTRNRQHLLGVGCEPRNSYDRENRFRARYFSMERSCNRYGTPTSCKGDTVKLSIRAHTTK